MTEAKQKAEIRKLQKSPTGFYVNLPKKIVAGLNVKGDELVKVATTNEPDKLTMEIIRV